MIAKQKLQVKAVFCELVISFTSRGPQRTGSGGSKRSLDNTLTGVPMQANDVRVLKSAALPTLVVGVIAVAVAFFITDAKGALGAALGTVLVGVFFSISV